TDDQADSAFVDREGTAWIGGTRGLNAFVRPSLIDDEVLPRGALGYAIVEDGRGSVYIVADGELYLVRPGQPPVLLRGGMTETLGVCASRRGGVWLVQGTTAEELIDGRTGRVLRLDRDHGQYGCAEDTADRLWIAAGDATLRIHDGREWRDESARLEGHYSAALGLDRQGRVIAADANLGLRRFDPDRTTVWKPGTLGIGQVIFARDTPGGLIVGGAGGFARMKDGRIERLMTARHPWMRKTRWMLETPEGEVWLFTYSGIVRMTAADWDAAFRRPDAPIPHRLFDALDGLTSGSDRLFGARAARGGDGRLWFLGVGGVMRLHPRNLSSNPLEPPVLIRGVKAGGRAVAVVDTIRLPAGATNLQIDYTALSLRTPTRVRFRYRLIGIDESWVEAGARRSAFYNSLKPGRYRFEVIAANDEGVWSTTGAATSISIAPMFWQTGWFTALCLLAAGVGSWFLYRLRLRVVAGRIRAGLGQRLAERERIARELHDTLLQGVQGLILRFQLIAEELPRNRPQRRAMEAALDEADTVLGEARDRVQDLRMTDLEAGDLDAALGQLAQSEAGPPPVGVFVEGEARPLERIAFDELFQIVREALVNARRHAGATCIEIRVRYAPGWLTVAVADDGMGVAPEVLKAGRAGHFGLTGMRERARRISARLRIESGPGAGTRVEIGLPGRLAYVAASREGGFAGWLGRLWHG
ncbi:MAG: hypothetical protein K0R83_906, partial [Caulobacter sp.]|nr:hypothetical protein [Caulobacter sp.]